MQRYCSVNEISLMIISQKEVRRDRVTRGVVAHLRISEERIRDGKGRSALPALPYMQQHVTALRQQGILHTEIIWHTTAYS